MVVPRRRFTTCQGNQMGFLITVETLRALLRARTTFHRRIQPVADKRLSHALNRRHTYIEGLADGFIRPTRLTVGLIGLEQNARMRQDFGRALAVLNEFEQVLAFVPFQFDNVFLGHRAPLEFD